MTDQPTNQQLDEIAARASKATPGPWEEHDDYGPHFYAYLRGPYLRGVGTLNFGDGEDAAADREFVKHAREDVDALLAEVRRLRFRVAELGEQGPDDRETVSEAAQMYRSLRTAIERTMTEPDRWDGDEDESFHLARYVEWLASERAQVRAEVLTEAADKLDRIGHAAAAWILRDDAARPAVPAVETGR